MNEQRRPVLVTGATGNTGNTGRALVDALTRRGTPVRAMVRSVADASRLPAGVSLAVADFDDAGSVAAALDGAEKLTWSRPRPSGRKSSSGGSPTWPSRPASSTSRCSPS